MTPPRSRRNFSASCWPAMTSSRPTDCSNIPVHILVMQEMPSTVIPPWAPRLFMCEKYYTLSRIPKDRRPGSSFCSCHDSSWSDTVQSLPPWHTGPLTAKRCFGNILRQVLYPLLVLRFYPYLVMHAKAGVVKPLHDHLDKYISDQPCLFQHLQNMCPKELGARPKIHFGHDMKIPACQNRPSATMPWSADAIGHSPQQCAFRGESLDHHDDAWYPVLLTQ